MCHFLHQGQLPPSELLYILKARNPNPLLCVACPIFRWNPYSLLCPAITEAAPHLSTSPARDSGSQLPMSSDLAGPRLTGSASQDARLSSEVPGSGQCRLTSCRDKVTVTSRLCLSQSHLPVRPHLQVENPRPKRGSHSVTLASL